MRAIHGSVRVAPVRRALSHGDQKKACLCVLGSLRPGFIESWVLCVCNCYATFVASLLQLFLQLFFYHFFATFSNSFFLQQKVAKKLQFFGTKKLPKKVAFLGAKKLEKQLEKSCIKVATKLQKVAKKVA